MIFSLNDDYSTRILSLSLETDEQFQFFIIKSNLKYTLNKYNTKYLFKKNFFIIIFS